MRSPVPDRPIHSSIVAFAVAGVSLLSLNRIFPTFFSSASREQQYSALPLEERHQPHASREPSPERANGAQSLSPQTQKKLFLLVIVALCLRVGLLRWTLEEIQCSQSGVEVGYRIIGWVLESMADGCRLLAHLYSPYGTSGGFNGSDPKMRMRPNTVYMMQFFEVLHIRLQSISCRPCF